MWVFGLRLEWRVNKRVRFRSPSKELPVNLRKEISRESNELNGDIFDCVWCLVCTCRKCWIDNNRQPTRPSIITCHRIKLKPHRDIVYLALSAVKALADEYIELLIKRIIFVLLGPYKGSEKMRHVHITDHR